jgi:hypothetical protein
MGLFAAVVVCFAASLVTAHDPFTEKMASLKRAVVIVTTYDDHGCPFLQGSGFFIASDRIVTNLHVISHASEIRIKTFAGKTFTVQAVLATDGDADLALLKMDIPCPDATTLRWRTSRQSKANRSFCSVTLRVPIGKLPMVV